MDKGRLQIHPAVEDEDLADIASAISQDSPAAADRVIDTITTAFGFLAQQPSMGTLYHPARKSLEGIRMIPATPYRNYLIFYRPLPNDAGVRILYVLHAARDIATFMKDHQRR